MIEFGKAYTNTARASLVYPCALAKFVSNGKDKDIVVFYIRNGTKLKYFARDYKDFIKRYAPITEDADTGGVR